MAVSGSDTEWEWVDSTRKMIRRKEHYCLEFKRTDTLMKARLSPKSLWPPVPIPFTHNNDVQHCQEEMQNPVNVVHRAGPTGSRRLQVRLKRFALL
jgi:hypothetical protein